MIKIKIKIAAAAAAVTILTGTLSANAEVTENITVLGDSISTGYGLEEDELSYCAYLKEYFGAKLDNFAVNGQQTEQLLEEIENDSSIRNSLENADLICVTIGGNDVLHIFEDALYSLDSGSLNSMGSQFTISQEFVQNFIMQYGSSFGPAAAQAGENITVITEKINEINPNAQVVMQTVYNPFETDNQQLNSVMKPLKTFASIYLGVINNSVKQQSAVIADIYTKLYENSWLYTNINEFDIHPNYIGHMLIAEEIIQNLKQTGNGEIFKTELEKIPDEYYDSIPDSVTSEILNLANGEFRAETLSDSYQDGLTAENETEASLETVQETTETSQTKETETKKKSKLSTIFLYAGITLIVLAALLKVCSKKRDG